MPQELLRYPATYVVVGVYRLLSDPSLNRPLWYSCSAALKRGAMVAAALCTVSYPFTRLWVRFFMRSNVLFSYSEEASLFHVPLATFATLSLVASQASMIIEWFVGRELRKARADAYEATVRSRGKGKEFWGSYVEEWEVPPVERARKRAEKRGFYAKLSGPIVRMLVSRVLLMPLHFIPFLGLIVSAGLSSLTLAELLHAPFFLSKGMTPYQQALFLTENEVNYRVFGFVAAMLERMPLLGMVFSVSNRIGAAMFAHDLEKRQHMFRTGQFKPTQRYESKTTDIPSDLPPSAVGAFPSKASQGASQQDVRAAAAGGGMGLGDGRMEVPGTQSVAIPGGPGVKRRVPPALPNRDA